MIGGIVGTLCAALLVWFPVMAATANVSGPAGSGTRTGMMAAAALIGFLAGSAVTRRARRDRMHIGLFSLLTCTVAGGLLGAISALALTVTYLHAYGAWPPDLGDQVLMALAFVAFGGLGLVGGAAIGLVAGGVTGGLLRVLLPNR
jgi:hypothetical protein